MYSATRLVNFLECAHCAWLDLSRTAEPAPADPETELLREKGLQHERAYLGNLRREGLTVVEIPTAESLETRAAQTREAMASGAQVIYQAALVKEHWFGYADFLRRVENHSALGSYSYEVVDTKLARSPSAARVIQLCSYSDMLDAMQGAAPHSMHLVLGDGSEASFAFGEFRHYYDEARRRFEAFAASPPPASYPRRCRYCELCQWREDCASRWEADDHLTLVAGIRQSQIRKLNDAGVETVRALGSLHADNSIPGMSEESLGNLRLQARLQSHKRETGEDCHELLAPREEKGFARLPLPDPGDLFFDIEGDPYYRDGLEYLFGVYYLEDGKPVFKDYWAHNHEEERETFRVLVDFLTARLAAHPGAHIYHYNHYEETALKRLMSRYGTREKEVDDLLRSRKLVDLYKVVREALRTSQPGYSLKDLETFYMEEREGDVKSAGESIVVYETWRKTGDRSLLEKIRDYNEADCRSTHLLREWLLDLRPEEIPWFEPPRKDDDDAGSEESEDRREELENRLVKNCPDDERPVRETVGHLLGYHRREDKPQWWAMFDRRDRTEEELIEDYECIGSLSRDRNSPVFQDKQSLVFSYRFPPQDSKLETGDTCKIAATLKPAGTIVSLDLEAGTLQLRRGESRGPLPTSLSVIPSGPIGNEVLRGAILRFAGSMAEGDGRYAAVRALLRRDLPVIGGVVPGRPILRSEKDLVGESIRAVRNLKSSYLLIQGPPGAGKTYTSAHIIVELIRTGCRVGVTSNSHKAIHNLLMAVETRANELRVHFRGIKKASGRNIESFYDSPRITNVTGMNDMDPSAHLFAGTAWLFADPLMDRVLDYLFVDEAGQVPLANIVAMGTSARNLVLVGDQMQLAQPVQGVHPGDSGLSALDYLLHDTATIPPERGIFLKTTWRMHADVCRFISDAVYDGRLHPEEKNRHQRLILGSRAHAELRPTGIRFVEVGHEGCSQKSEEEARVVKALYQSLLKQRYRDREGSVHALGKENILVVAPYNVQVNYLKTVLPAGARVGTVDKFQGQEAEVVIVSMTTSSGEELPRGIEFLFSRNRLNVAISRARCLAILVASPRLLATPCRTVEELRLVDTLCRARAYAERGSTRISTDS